jgi:peptidoglycan/xylan/chitin deacetylase (PgdA/CDA1 family)
MKFKMDERSGTYELLTVILISAVILAILPLEGFLFPIVSYGQLPYLPNHQQSSENQQSTTNYNSAQNQSKSPIQSKNAYNASEALHTIIITKGKSPANSNITIITSNGNGTNNKVAMITFGDGWISQFTTAKPILDKYAFKASFYIPCNFPGLNDLHMTWHDIAALQSDGMHIESKGMNDIILTNVSASKLNF